MPVQRSNMQLVWARSGSHLLTVRDADGTLVNLTGRTLRLRVKLLAGNPDPPFIAKSTGSGIVHADQALAPGQATVQYVPADTSSLPNAPASMPYELDMLDGSDVWPLAEGMLVVAAAV